MPLFGAHLSIAGGCHNALLAAQKHGCEALQIFTTSPQSWCVPARKAGSRFGKLLTMNSNQRQGKVLKPEQAALFRQTRGDTKVRVLVSHDSYLINLASPEQQLYRRSR